MIIFGKVEISLSPSSPDLLVEIHRGHCAFFVPNHLNELLPQSPYSETKLFCSSLFSIG